MAISGVLLPWLVLCWHGRLCLCRNSVLCFKIQYHLIICDFFFGGGLSCFIKTIENFISVCLCVLFCVLLVFGDFRFELCDNSSPSLFENDREFL